jgi:hypothetical protein
VLELEPAKERGSWRLAFRATEAAWWIAYAGAGPATMAVLEASSEEPRDPVAAWEYRTDLVA